MLGYYIFTILVAGLSSWVAYCEGVERTAIRKDEQHAKDYMDAFNQGFVRGRKQGHIEGEREGREKGYEDGKRYGMAVHHNEEVLREIGVLPDDGKNRSINPYQSRAISVGSFPWGAK